MSGGIIDGGASAGVSTFQEPPEETAADKTDIVWNQN